MMLSGSVRQQPPLSGEANPLLSDGHLYQDTSPVLENIKASQQMFKFGLLVSYV